MAYGESDYRNSLHELSLVVGPGGPRADPVINGGHGPL